MYCWIAVLTFGAQRPQLHVFSDDKKHHVLDYPLPTWSNQTNEQLPNEQCTTTDVDLCGFQFAGDVLHAGAAVQVCNGTEMFVHFQFHRVGMRW